MNYLQDKKYEIAQNKNPPLAVGDLSRRNGDQLLIADASSQLMVEEETTLASCDWICVWFALLWSAGACEDFTAICGAMINETIDINLMRMFIDGPEVSLNGSPTVSPVTEALCGSDFL